MPSDKVQAVQASKIPTSTQQAAPLKLATKKVEI